jgi:uncharacterized membrane protein YebE (DUF533 family)
MIDAKSLLDRFLGPDGKGSGQLGGQLKQVAGGHSPSPAKPGRSLPGGIPAGFLGGAGAGGLIGLLLGGRKKSKGVGGVLSHGGAAALGALAYRAYQNWQQEQARGAPPADDSFLPESPAADGQPFALALVRAMIGAAKADGHVDAAEQQAIFAQVEQAGLDAEAKALVFEALSRPTDLDAIAASARTPEQAAELFLASRLAIDPDHPAERSYLDALAHRLKLPPGLADRLSAEAATASGG